MNPQVEAALIGAGVAVAIHLAIYAAALYRRKRSDDVVRVFVRDIAVNHLPHIYNALQKIAVQQGVELEETPLVQFVDFNGRNRRREAS